jgi:hypothetical protein
MTGDPRWDVRALPTGAVVADTDDLVDGASLRRHRDALLAAARSTVDRSFGGDVVQSVEDGQPASWSVDVDDLPADALAVAGRLGGATVSVPGGGTTALSSGAVVRSLLDGPVRFVDVGGLLAPLGSLGASIASLLDARTEVTAVVAAGPTTLAPGRQDADEILVGLAGQLDLALWPPGTGVPAGETRPPVWRGPVARGDGFLVPSGWSFGLAVSAPTAWASIRLRRPGPADVAAYVADRLAGSLPFRLDLPAAEPTGPDAGAVDWSSPEVEALVRRSTAEAPGWWRANLPTVSTAAPADVLRALTGPAAGLRWSAPGGLARVVELPPSTPAPAPGSMALAGGGLLISVPQDVTIDRLDLDEGTTAGAPAPAAWRRDLLLGGVLSPCPFGHTGRRPAT